jgi:voltage-gated sodium channel
VVWDASDGAMKFLETDAKLSPGKGKPGASPGGSNAEGEGLRDRVRAVVNAEWFRSAILAVIIFNAICLGLDTDAGIHANFGGLLDRIDLVVTAIFVVEIGLKLYAERWAFFRSGWNIFDFVIVGISLLTLFFSDATAAGAISILRVLRIFRVFRLFGALPALRRVVDALFKSIPGISAIVAVLGLLFYVCSVMATQLFGERFPEQFGTLPTSLLSLFQLMTLDGWSGEIVRPVLGEFPWAWVFFIPFIFLASFAILNLFIAVIVEALQQEQTEKTQEIKEELVEEIEETKEELHEEIGEVQERAADDRQEILSALAALRGEIIDLKAHLSNKA